MIENVRQAVQNANLYTYLGKIDKIVGTTVEAMGPACKIGDVCTIDVPGDNPPVKAEVVGFRENRVLLMPYEESRAFVDSLDGVEAIWLFPDGSKKMTFGAMNVAKSCGASNR